MKTKDIKADGATVYAYAKEYEWKPDRYGGGRRANPVVVTATRRNRKTWTGYGYAAADGVQVTFLTDDLKPTERVGIVRPAEIRELWETYKPAADAEAKARRESQAQALEDQRKTAARLDALWARLPKGTPRPWWAQGDGIHADKSMTKKGEMYRTELAELLEATYSAGYDAGFDARGEDER